MYNAYHVVCNVQCTVYITYNQQCHIYIYIYIYRSTEQHMMEFRVWFSTGKAIRGNIKHSPQPKL